MFFGYQGHLSGNLNNIETQQMIFPLLNLFGFWDIWSVLKESMHILISFGLAIAHRSSSVCRNLKKHIFLK